MLQSVIYGFGDPISKIAFDAVPVYAMMTVRYTIAFAVCFLLFRKRIVNTVKTVPAKAWLIPGMCIGLSYVLNNVALSMTEATSVAFLRSMSVIMTPAIAFLAFGKKYRWQPLLAQVRVLPGIYLLCVGGGVCKRRTVGIRSGGGLCSSCGCTHGRRTGIQRKVS